jgi:hypothetical protein
MGKTRRHLARPPKEQGSPDAVPVSGKAFGRSRPFAGAGYIGAIPEQVWEVLEKAWEEPLYVSSNFAREQAISIAFAASMGWLSNIEPSGRTYSRKWHLTAEGLIAIRHKEG